MKNNEVIRRIVFVIRAIGVIVLLLGAVALKHTGPSDQVTIAIVFAIFAMPFFVVAWIVDGFCSKARPEQEECERLVAEMRRNSQLGTLYKKTV